MRLGAAVAAAGAVCPTLRRYSSPRTTPAPTMGDASGTAKFIAVDRTETTSVTSMTAQTAVPRMADAVNSTLCHSRIKKATAKPSIPIEIPTSTRHRSTFMCSTALRIAVPSLPLSAMVGPSVCVTMAENTLKTIDPNATHTQPVKQISAASDMCSGQNSLESVFQMNPASSAPIVPTLVKN
eukprot:1999653-Prymnesium_polylepis.1